TGVRDRAPGASPAAPGTSCHLRTRATRSGYTIPAMRFALRITIVLAALAIAACEEREEHASTATSPPASAAADSGVTLMPIDGSSVLALAARGGARVTLVSVWATWCRPCRQEFPELLDAARAHRSEGVRLVL